VAGEVWESGRDPGKSEAGRSESDSLEPASQAGARGQSSYQVGHSEISIVDFYEESVK
jgi:hypothetical protein